MPRLFFILFLLMFTIASAFAVDPKEILEDSALETRARDISKSLRCIVCQNQSIDDSDAILARDLRVLVRERLAAGDTNSQVMDYIVSRYGDFVLLKPPLKPGTIMLWLGPFIIITICLTAGIIFFRRQRSVLEHPPISITLTSQEREKIDNILKD